MKARCPECSATYEVPRPERPKRARCRCGATFLIAPDEEPAAQAAAAATPSAARSVRQPEPAPPRHSVKPTRTVSVPAVVIGAVMIVFSLGWAWLAFAGTVVMASNGGPSSEGSVILMLVSLFFAGATALGGFGLIFSKPWGWWLAIVFQVGGLLLFGRFFFTYLAMIDWDHREAQGALFSISIVYGLPFLIALALVAGLFLPSVRLACGVKSKPLPARRARRAGTPRAAR